ncbi:hemerythrin superfamily protein [Phycicoccus badiiscoriae]|uniref:Hemerythrin superfamily protein n=1 Tax=Pedococcus badiiscoriae TaxID=642776 RepID=A0A852WA82_9MICO|nr:hemerythrin domain-containing protein [Pedococcus badiiscoriae]NYG05953.1 hemerythrin superfamily protein [Pedococcus badiiscoriae]
MTDYEIPRPTDGDVVDLILDDHRLFEALLRDLRDATADREAARAALSAVLIAHGEAEESKVYSTLRRKDAITPHEAEHGEEEHAEGNEALLALLECKGTDTQKFDDAVEDLATALNHHIGEEEQTILNPARTEVSEEVRQDLGAQWATERNRLLDAGVGSLTSVRKVVARAHREGLLPADDEEGDKEDGDKEDKG